MAARLAGNTHALSAFLADVRDWDAFRLFARRRSGRLPRVWSDRLTPHSRRPSLTSGTIKHPGGKYDETASTSSSGSTDYEACESASAHSYPSSLLHDEEELRKEFARQEADWQTEKRVLQCALRDAEEKVEAAIRVMTGALADMKGSNNGSTTHLCSSLRHGNCVQVMTSPRSSSAGRPMTDTPTDSALSESLTKISPSGDKLHATPSSSSSSPRRSTPATFLKSSTSSLSSRRSTPKHPYLTHHHHPSSGNKPSRRSLSKKVSFGNDTIWREHDESNRSCCNDVGSAVVDDHHASSSESTSDMYVDAPMQQQQPVMAIPTSIPSPTRRSFDSIRDAQPPQPRQLLRKRASYDIASSTSTLYKLNNVSFVAKKQQAEESLPCFDGGEDSSGAEDPIGKLKGGGGGMMGQRKTTRSVDIPPRIPDSPPAYAQSTNIDAATHPPSPPSTAHHPDMIPTPLSLVEVEKRRPIDPSIPPAESVESSLSLSSSSSAASSNNDFPVIHIPPPVVSGCLDPTPPPPPQIPAKPSPDHQNHQPTLPKRRSFLATFNRSDQLTMIRPTCDGLSTGEAQLQIQSMAAATSAGGGQEGTMTRKWGKLLRGRG
ncbi:hypothetical protein DFS34DRAFT_616844 [Phlyctochytrium arcticum]|nr:hypothetical protein DFS34DRAFT_616844 [Phlyctochytrium arcticum]